MFNVFYAHSTHRDLTQQMYYKISEYFETNKQHNIHIMDMDDAIQNHSIFYTIITENLKKADLLICDITPDFTPYEHENKNTFDICPCINSNTMFELGYFSSLHKDRDIILIIDKNFADGTQSLLRGHYVLRYTDINDMDFIIERIMNFRDNYEKIILRTF